MRSNLMNPFRSLLMVAVAAAILAPAAQAQSYRIVANNDVRVQSLTKKEASDIFMKKMTRWQGGTAVVPVDQVEGSLREDFSKSIHGKSVAAVKSYWNQQIFSGRDIPPVEKTSDADVLAFVRATSGAVGYVSESAPTAGVHVISVE